MASGSLGQSASQIQAQTMVLGARQLAALEILELPATDLEGWLTTVAERNEALRVVPVERRHEPVMRGGGSGAEASDRHAEWMANLPGQEPDWRAELQEQLAWADLSPEREAWLVFLIERLDGHGLLTEDDDSLLEAAREAGLGDDAAALGRAIAELQRFEPRGVGGRSPEEALLLQLEPEDADYEQLCLLIERFLDDVARNKLPAVARSIGLGLGELDRLLGRLGELDLRPVAEAAGLAEGPIRPDVIALPEGDRIRLEFPKHSLPSVEVDPRLAALATDSERPAEERRYARKKVAEAKSVVEAVAARGATLERVARSVFERQHGYLRNGPGHLTPLSMGELAERLELHLSTVSRAVAGKFVQTPWGVEPLRKFFQTTSGGAGAAGQATDNVRERVRAIIANENPSEPLSDDSVAVALAAEGLDVARRTVAKYRRELGIPSSYRRRRFDAD